MIAPNHDWQRDLNGQQPNGAVNASKTRTGFVRLHGTGDEGGK